MGELFKQNNTNVDIADLTQGMSRKGMGHYNFQLYRHLTVLVRDKLEDVSAIQTAVDAGWQGESRDKFLADFEANIRIVEDQIREAYDALYARIVELTSNYYKQDRDLL